MGLLILWIALLLFPITAVVVLQLRNYYYKRRIINPHTGQLISGPSPLRVLYDTFFKNIHFAMIDYQRTYGNIFHLCTLQSVITICHPQELKKLLIQPGFDKHLVNFSNRWFQLFNAQKGLVFLNGKEWKIQRQLLNQSFMDVSQFIPHSCVKIEQLLDQWEKQPLRNIYDDTKRLTLDILGYSIFDKDFELISGKQSSFLHNYEEFTSSILTVPRILFDVYNYMPITSNRRLEHLLEYMKSFCKTMIQERQAALKNLEKPKSLIDLMLVSTDEQGNKMAMDDIILSTFGFLLAGHETTQTAICHELYFLAKYPEWRQKIDQELQTVFKEKYHDKYILPTKEELNELELLQSFIKEVLRIYPPVAFLFSRTPSHAKEGEMIQIGDYETIAKGLVIDINILAIHRNKQVWGEDADEFKPERFMKGNKHVPYSYLPFGLGPRRCIGEAFSLQEQMIVLLNIIKRFELQLVSPKYDIAKDIQFLKASNSFCLKVCAK